MSNKIFGYVVFAVLLCNGVLAANALQMTLITNKDSISPTDIIILDGTLTGGPSQLVAVQVNDPSGQTVLARTLQTDDNGNFELQFKIPSSDKSGSYDIMANAQVNGQKITQTKTISFSSSGYATSGGNPASGGKCMIATAAFGSEMAPQVQQLRETRDDVVMKTASGAMFMTGFNAFYYSFAPTVADWERENPIFKESVKATITPLITTLSILNYIPIHSDAEMLFYGILVILLNIGIYFIGPVFAVMKFKNHLTK